MLVKLLFLFPTEDCTIEKIKLSSSFVTKSINGLLKCVVIIWKIRWKLILLENCCSDVIKCKYVNIKIVKPRLFRKKRRYKKLLIRLVYETFTKLFNTNDTYYS